MYDKFKRLKGSEMLNVKFKKLDENATAPSFNYEDDAGLDFFSNENTEVSAKGFKIISTGIALQLPRSYISNEIKYKYFVKLFSRSGLACKHGLEIGAGVIDSSYTGEVKIFVHNFGKKNYKINKHDKIAQGVLYAIPQYGLIEETKLNETSRGNKGFGSSGK